MYTLPNLPYDVAALEPHIDAKTMELHHDKHHATYIDKLNAALAGHDDLMALDIDALVQKINDVPEDIRQLVRNNGGGHANHSLFWTLMSPNGGGEPDSDLAAAINQLAGSFSDFKSTFKDAALSRFGSGWVWLIKDENGLKIMTTANQDSPLSDDLYPVLALDVWEHAYYLKYQNKRPDYIDAWWNVVNWPEVAKRYASN